MVEKIKKMNESYRENNNVLSLASVKGFYFLDYFYVLLQSAEKNSNAQLVFEKFIELKDRYRLGESKYKKIPEEPHESNSAEISSKQKAKYRYTFNQVLHELKLYKLVEVSGGSGSIQLTKQGEELLAQYKEKDPNDFNTGILKCIEDRFKAFRYLLGLIYKIESSSPELIIPKYSPHKLKTLNMLKGEITTGQDIEEYLQKLIEQLAQDARRYLNTKITTESLIPEVDKVKKKLINEKLITATPQHKFESKNYNAIVSRIRNHFSDYFLKNIYDYQYTLHSFYMWVYRAKQLGILHATEFHPDYSGQIIFPTSVIANSNTIHPDFQPVYTYEDGSKLYLHKPQWDQIQDQFVNVLHETYLALKSKRYRNTYYINLLAVRERVCYALRIAEKYFDFLLGKAYEDNLRNLLRIKISMEVDKLPEERGAMYEKRELVKIRDRYLNIIAIDVV